MHNLSKGWLDEPRGRCAYNTRPGIVHIPNSPRNLPAEYQQVVEKEQVDFSKEFLGAERARCLWAIHLLQLPLL